MSSRLCSTAFFLTVLGCSSVAFTSQAKASSFTLDTSAGVISHIGGSCSQLGTSVATCSVTNTVSLGGNNTESDVGIAGASASYGVLHATAQSLAGCNPTTASCDAFDVIQAEGEADFQDTIAFTAALPPSGAASGILVFNFLVTGIAEDTCVGTFAFNACASTPLPRAELLAPGAIVTDSSPLYPPFTAPWYISVAYPFRTTTGQVSVGTDIEFLAQSTCTALTGTSCVSEASFNDTAIVTSLYVEDASGNIDTNAVITTASGTDYNSLVDSTSPVPEPSTLGLLAIGMLGLVRVARRSMTTSNAGS